MTKAARRIRDFVGELSDADRLTIVRERAELEESGVYGEETRAAAGRILVDIFGPEFSRQMDMTYWMDRLYVETLRFYAEPAMKALQDAGRGTTAEPHDR